MKSAAAEPGRRQTWPALLVAAITGFSFVYSCAAPFAAFSVLAAMTLSRADALRMTLVLWLANQILGYAVLGYPRTVNSFSWGLAMGGAAVLGTLIAQWIVSRLQAAAGLTQSLAALGGAFVVYEVSLFTLAVAVLGGTGIFEIPITGRILAVNTAALAGLYLLYRLDAAIGISRRRTGASARQPIYLSEER